MKKLLCAVLALMLMLSLAACDEVYIEKIEGSWSIQVLESDEQKQVLMDNIEMYEEEIALVDTALYTTKTVTFNADKTYSFAENAEDVKQGVEDFYRGLFDDLYEGRDSLYACYEVDMSSFTQEQFRQFYADLYAAEDYEAMIQLFTDNAYNYDELGIYETGTYTITATRITMDTLGTEDDGYVGYSVDGDSLTLKFNDATEVYNKVN